MSSEKENSLAEKVKSMGIGTQLINLKLPAPKIPIEPVMPAIYKTTMYEVHNVDEISEQLSNGYFYARVNTPNSRELEQVLTAIDGGVEALVFPGGMPAITAVLMNFLRPGDHIVAQRSIYSGTHLMLETVLPTYNIEVSMVAAGDGVVDRMRDATKPNTKMYLGETIANPTLEILDLKAFGQLGQENSIMTAVDATFSTPINQNPISYGVDITMHSCTKFMCGHSDIMAGCCVFRKKEHYQSLLMYRMLTTSLLDPTNCYELLRSLKTLHLRMERHNKNAMRVAQYLEAHPKVKRVIYPGLPSHPQHELAKSMMKGFGGILSLSLYSEEAAKTLVTKTRIFHLTASLGGVEGLVELVCKMSHGDWAMDDKMREELGIDRGMVRLSVGVEDVEDIISDLEQSLEHVKPEVEK